MAIDQELARRSSSNKSLDDTRHQVANNYKVAHAYTKTLYGDRSIKNDGRIGIRKLRQGEERSRTPIEILRASCLEVKTEPSGQSSPDDDDYSKDDSHMRKGERHGEDTGADDYLTL